MSTLKSPRTLKFVLPLLALVFTISIAFAFTNTKKQPATKPVTMTTLYFQYQLATYGKSQVETQNNWNLIAPGEACESDGNDVTCSFSIRVPEEDQALYLNSTHPSSLVSIESSISGTDYRVTDVKEASSTILSSIENIKR
ncbi:DUF6520 family protein [Niabella sp.]|uniref:DUF6520 family protein n=1 Tax=Niabella sp. TaxID=1962976 RepID=UPI0026319FA0|nr:DUF6520 family protein [Niabella sp.]